jgi:hypothetical protein
MMRTVRTLAIAILIVVSSPAFAQVRSVQDYLNRVTSVDPRRVSEADCASSVSRANILNAADLFRASAVCHAVNKQVEGSFRLSAAQVRAMADMGLMAPAAKEDVEAMTALYGFIFYYAGGPGAEDVLRNASARAQLLELFDGWSPIAGANYSPGWNVGKRPVDRAYQEAVTEAKAHRRKQLVDISRLFSDEEYYSLHRQFSELQKRNPGGFVENTPDARLSSNLQERMASRARAMGLDTGPAASEASFDRSMEPPSAPGPGEALVAASDDPTVKQCVEWAEKLALMTASKITRVVVTTGSEWGVVWRADIASSDKPPQMSRYICSQHGTLHESGDAMERPPLP